MKTLEFCANLINLLTVLRLCLFHKLGYCLAQEGGLFEFNYTRFVQFISFLEFYIILFLFLKLSSSFKVWNLFYFQSYAKKEPYHLFPDEKLFVELITANNFSHSTEYPKQTSILIRYIILIFWYWIPTSQPKLNICRQNSIKRKHLTVF